MTLVLGVWDGHDAGAALVEGGRIVFAINEERLSRRKLEIGFPVRSIQAALEFAAVSPEHIEHVACTTTDFAKTLTRLVPALRERYYQLRRRKQVPGPLYAAQKLAKYRLTEIPPFPATQILSRVSVRRELHALGVTKAQLHFVGHHDAHAACAAFTSGFEHALVATLDGIGDGLCGSLWRYSDGRLARIAALDGRASFGIFFEHVTNLLNMRELEDEGKVMALANYAAPIPDSDNPLLAFFQIDPGPRLRSPYTSGQMVQRLRDILWSYPAEQFAYLAQRTLEVRVVEYLRAAMAAAEMRDLAYAGGVASNVRVNLLLRETTGIERLFVFPHMGDGGQALGAALWIDHQVNNASPVPISHVQLGPEYSGEAIDAALEAHALCARVVVNPAEAAADLLAAGAIVFWFQGRMEYGPRALGGRSILARADSRDIRDALNLTLKKRVWYQPFCPSMLADEARVMLDNYDGTPEPFMTCAYRVRPQYRDALQGVISVDGTCRPQILRGDEATPYTRLLLAMRERIGRGVVLNTSFNVHGEPMVCTPADAVRTFLNTDVQTMVIGDRVVSKTRAAHSK